MQEDQRDRPQLKQQQRRESGDEREKEGGKKQFAFGAREGKGANNANDHKNDTKGCFHADGGSSHGQKCIGVPRESAGVRE